MFLCFTNKTIHVCIMAHCNYFHMVSTQTKPEGRKSTFDETLSEINIYDSTVKAQIQNKIKPTAAII